MLNKMELLAPAGDLEKLKFACNYGADAVYMGGTALGLRAKAKNFDESDMARGIEYAHGMGKKVYITANVFAHNTDFHDMARYFRQVAGFGADALIVSDMGVFSAAREAVPDMAVHISTQANVTNSRAALAWRKLGASRVILARELLLDEIREIHKETRDTGLELEVFVHGAMCMAYSGRCLLSNFLTARDANRGECAHVCRWKYSVVEETRPGEYMPVIEEENGAYIFNSKDLCMIRHLDALADAGISSVKIEGRMKTPYYVASAVKAYKEALDDFYNDPVLYESKKAYYMEEAGKSSHREFSTGFFFSKPTEHIYESGSYIRSYDFLGVVLDYDAVTQTATIEQRNRFRSGEAVEFLTKKGCGFTQIIGGINDSGGEPVAEANHACQIVTLKTDKPVSAFDIMLKKL